MRVGALEETITVTGESPVVDTQGVVQRNVLPAMMIDLGLAEPIRDIVPMT